MTTETVNPFINYDDRDPDAIDGVLESISSGTKCHKCDGDDFPFLLAGRLVLCGDCYHELYVTMKDHHGDGDDDE